MKKGIDVSHYQGTIDWEQVKTSGIEFAMILAGWGNNHIDSQFERNITECNRLKIPVGIYWFSYALSVEDAQREALQCLFAINNHKVDYPVCYDFEYDTVLEAAKSNVILGKNECMEFTKAFCETIKDGGYIPMYYMNLDYSLNMFDEMPYDLWYAWSGIENDRICDMGQSPWTEHVPGIEYEVDIDICYKEYVKMDEVKNADEALKVWVDAGIITNPAKWKKVLEFLKDFDALLIKMTNAYLKKG